MTSPVFLDTNVFVYATTNVPERDSSLAILEAVGAGSLEGSTSALVIEELWHLEGGRSGVKPGAARDAYVAMRPVLAVTDEVLALAFSLDLPTIGAMDRLHAASCRLNGIDTIVSADRGFDELPGFDRVDPTDPAAVERLLA